jgi:hypothetical protein
MGFSIGPISIGGSSAGKSNPFSDILGSLGSSLGAGAGAGILNNFFGSDPAKDALDMMDMLYPGTTPYERLSAGGGGAAQAGAQENIALKAMQSQKDMVQMQTKAQKEVAEINKSSAKDVAGINAGIIKPFPGTQINENSKSANWLVKQWKKETSALDRATGWSSFWNWLNATSKNVSQETKKWIKENKEKLRLSQESPKTPTSVGRPIGTFSTDYEWGSSF